MTQNRGDCWVARCVKTLLQCMNELNCLVMNPDQWQLWPVACRAIPWLALVAPREGGFKSAWISFLWCPCNHFMLIIHAQITYWAESEETFSDSCLWVWRVDYSMNEKRQQSHDMLQRRACWSAFSWMGNGVCDEHCVAAWASMIHHNYLYPKTLSEVKFKIGIDMLLHLVGLLLLPLTASCYTGS